MGAAALSQGRSVSLVHRLLNPIHVGCEVIRQCSGEPFRARGLRPLGEGQVVVRQHGALLVTDALGLVTGWPGQTYASRTGDMGPLRM